MTVPVGTVITVYRGGCEVVYEDRVVGLRLIGRHAHQDQALAVGDEVSFDPDKQVVDQIQPRRTKLARRRPRAAHREQVIAANMDQLGIVCSVQDPPFRAGAVDRFLLAASAGGLEALLLVNKIDLLDGMPLPEEIRAYAEVTQVLPLSAETGEGIAALRSQLEGCRTVIAGHSGVGKSSLINALEPELRLETQELTAKFKRGRHTTTAAIWLRLSGGGVVVDTPGVREIASGPVDLELLGAVYPDVFKFSSDCRFRDCAHGAEPDCAVRAAIESGQLRPTRLASYRKLLAEASA